MSGRSDAAIWRVVLPSPVASRHPHQKECQGLRQCRGGQQSIQPPRPLAEPWGPRREINAILVICPLELNRNDQRSVRLPPTTRLEQNGASRLKCSRPIPLASLLIQHAGAWPATHTHRWMPAGWPTHRHNATRSVSSLAGAWEAIGIAHLPIEEEVGQAVSLLDQTQGKTIGRAGRLGVRARDQADS